MSFQGNALGASAGTNNVADLAKSTGANNASASARYAKLKEAEGRVSIARESMDRLAELRDTVTQDDVVKAAGRLVSAGAGAAEIAGMLAEMPPDGDALAGWIAQKDLKLRELEGQLEAAKDAARYKLGVSALQHIVATQANHQFGQQGQPQAPEAAVNALMTGVP